jgi:hypothetical protein
MNKKTGGLLFRKTACNFTAYLFFRLMAAWAAASRAIGTRNGEQDT